MGDFPEKGSLEVFGEGRSVLQATVFGEVLWKAMQLQAIVEDVVVVQHLVSVGVGQCCLWFQLSTLLL